MEQASAWTKAFDGGKFVRKSSEFRDKLSLDGVFDFESEDIISTFHMLVHGLIAH